MTAPDPRLNEIQARLSAATPGPWEHGHHWDSSEWIKGGIGGRKFRPASDTTYEWLPTSADAEFIANAPADVAFLLAELRKARESLERVEGLTLDPEHYDSRGPSNGYVSVDDIRAAVAAANRDGRG